MLIVCFFSHITLWFMALCILDCFLSHPSTLPPFSQVSPLAPIVNKHLGLQLVSNFMTVTLKKPTLFNFMLQFLTVLQYKSFIFPYSCLVFDGVVTFTLFLCIFSPFSGVFLSCLRVQVTIKHDHCTGCEVKGHVITQPPEQKTRAAVRQHATLLLLAQMHCND